MVSVALEAGILAGVSLGRWYEDLADCLLVTVTEKRTKSEIDSLADCFTQASTAGSVARVQG